MTKVNMNDATVNLLIELDGEVYVAAMDKDKLDAITLLARTAVKTLVKTGKTQEQLVEFLGLSKHVTHTMEGE